jgi:3(or 17)beta-hydroxysteroid dehydrogenase
VEGEHGIAGRARRPGNRGGIGHCEATASLLAQAGAAVLATDVEVGGATRVAEAIQATGGEALAMRLDVTDEDAWRAAIRGATERWGRLDILVANAGISSAYPVTDMPLDEWRRVMAVNLDGAFLGTKHAVSAMRAGGRGGSIAIVSSTSGLNATPGASAYAASKAEVRLFAKSVALEVAAEGIQVNTVLPAGVETPTWKGSSYWEQLVAEHGGEQGAWEALAASTPMRRFAQPVEVARAILFLAGDASSYMTGAELVVDGGFTA